VDITEAVTAWFGRSVRPMVWCTSDAQGATGGPLMIQENWDESVQRRDVIDFLSKQIPKGVWEALMRRTANVMPTQRAGLVGPSEYDFRGIDGKLGLSAWQNTSSCEFGRATRVAQRGGDGLLATLDFVCGRCLSGLNHEAQGSRSRDGVWELADDRPGRQAGKKKSTSGRLESGR